MDGAIGKHQVQAMNSTTKRSLWILIGTAWTGLSGLPAVADDTELFITDPALLNQSPPNILFVLDTSGSMDTFLQTQPTYDPSVVYPGACATDRMYWRTGYTSIGGDDNAPPYCATDNWFNASALTCAAAITALKKGTGYYTDRFAQFDDSAGDNARWLALDSSQKSRYVECQDDAGLHGETAGDTDVYPQNGNDNDPWTSSSSNSISWRQTPANVTYNVYDGNFVNWYYGPLALAKRLGVMQDVTTNLLDQISDVNVGLMRFNRTEGGPVIHAIEDVDTARSAMQAKIAELPSDGWTPLSETLY
jgi:type IV pilus assembly protein PilY1